MTGQQANGQPSTDSALVMTERVGAAAEEIFEFLVDPEKMLRWMGTEVNIDPQPGGTFWVEITGENIASGSYVEVDPPNRVVFTWGWEGSTHVPPASSTVTITLTPDGEDTIVELRHDGLPTGPDDEHKKGWTSYLGRLSAVAEGRDPGPAPHGDER